MLDEKKILAAVKRHMKRKKSFLATVSVAALKKGNPEEIAQILSHLAAEVENGTAVTQYGQEAVQLYQQSLYRQKVIDWLRAENKGGRLHGLKSALAKAAGTDQSKLSLVMSGTKRPGRLSPDSLSLKQCKGIVGYLEGRAGELLSFTKSLPDV